MEKKWDRRNIMLRTVVDLVVITSTFLYDVVGLVFLILFPSVCNPDPLNSIQEVALSFNGGKDSTVSFLHASHL